MGGLLKDFPFTFAFVLIALWASTRFGLSWLSIAGCVVAALFAGAGIDYTRSERRAGR
jgi:integral membrane sensor domain MASE1